MFRIPGACSPDSDRGWRPPTARSASSSGVMRSPSTSTTVSVYSPNQLATSRLDQPPRRCSAAGRSQWKRVGNGSMPASSKPIDEAVVEVQALPVDRAGSLRQHPRPADRESVRTQSELAHQRDVLRPAVVVVARDRARLARGSVSRASRRTRPRRSGRRRPPAESPRSGRRPSPRPRGSGPGAPPLPGMPVSSSVATLPAEP